MSKKQLRERNKIFSLTDSVFDVLNEQMDLFLFERPFLTSTPGESLILPYLEKQKELAIKFDASHLELISALNEYEWRTV